MMQAHTHVLILGLGDSGLSMVRWCVSQGARVTVVDDRPQPPHASELAQWAGQVTLVHSEFNASLVQGSDVRAVFKSPGLTPNKVQAVWQAAKAQGLWVGTELTLFQSELDQLHQAQGYAPKILAITGTNGKTTVTQLTTHLIERSGASVAMAGNVGPCLMDTLLKLKDALPDIWVLELSSFQLDEVNDFKPTAATVLNITQDHLDWHGDMATYARAKFNVFGPVPAATTPALAVVPRHDATIMAWLNGAQEACKKAKQTLSWQSFGPDLPQRPGDWGLEEVHGMTWLVRAHPADETQKRRKNDEEPEIHVQRLMPADALRIRGRHNALNALAALALATAAGRSMASLLYGLREYAGEPHRTQSVAIIDEVHYIDDSKGTNVGATVAALEGLGVQQRLVVILGGEGKGQDFSPLLEPIRQHARAVVLMGQDAPLIEAAIQASGVDIHHAVDMTEAVRRAARCAVAGDAVLLSPACASLDMYRNYVHRAQVFVQAVQELGEEAGTP